MKKLIFLVLILLTSCYKDISDINDVPFILCTPSGKPWAVEEVILDGVDKTTLLEGQYMWFYWPITSDPNVGRIETNLVYGNWRHEVSTSDDYLHITFPYTRNNFTILNNRWRITDKWTNRIEMRDPTGNRLVIKVGN